MADTKDTKIILILSGDEEFNRRIKTLKMAFPLKFSIQKGSYETLQVLRKKKASLVILDYNMPLISGDELIGIVHDSYPNIPIITLIDDMPREKKMEILDAGAFDYLERPFDFESLATMIQNLLFSEAYHYHVAELREKIKKTFGLENIIGDCKEMWKVFHAVKNISDSDVSVFISGESGTGKELLARAIHRSSLRKNKPLTVINCAAIPENLLESELFGHEKGSFSGAISQRIGKFELADKGTIFLDEIGEMSHYTQSKILRLLEEQEFERVGGNKTIRIDVRIITATNRNLEEEVRASRFREDLYYRINVYPIHLPALRERPDDIPLLVFYFLNVLSKKNHKEVMSINPAALDILKTYSWPGNIRELEHVLERAILNCPGKLLTVEQFSHLSAKESIIPPVKSEQIAEIPGKPLGEVPVLPLKQLERRAIERALQQNDGNVSHAAQQLEIGRATLYRKIREYDIPFENAREQ